MDTRNTLLRFYNRDWAYVPTKAVKREYVGNIWHSGGGGWGETNHLFICWTPLKDDKTGFWLEEVSRWRKVLKTTYWLGETSTDAGLFDWLQTVHPERKMKGGYLPRTDVFYAALIRAGLTSPQKLR